MKIHFMTCYQMCIGISNYIDIADEQQSIICLLQTSFVGCENAHLSKQINLDPIFTSCYLVSGGQSAAFIKCNGSPYFR